MPTNKLPIDLKEASSWKWAMGQPEKCKRSMAYRGNEYRCSAVSIEGLVQQVAVSYLRHGYWWYVTGTVPEGKDPTSLDRKLIDKYGIQLTERERAFRKRSGMANMQYIRHDRFYILMCTEGLHPFRQAEAASLRDARKTPILVPRLARPRKSNKKRSAGSTSGGSVFEGYAISYRRGHWLRKSSAERKDYRQQRAAGRRPCRGTRDVQWHSRVEIERRTYKMLRAYYLNIAVQRSVSVLSKELGQVPYEPYAPVRQQMLALVRDINRARKVAGASDQVPWACLRLKRNQIHPFAQVPTGIGAVNGSN